MSTFQLFKAPALSSRAEASISKCVSTSLGGDNLVLSLETEFCYSMQFEGDADITSRKQDAEKIYFLLEGETESPAPPTFTTNFDTKGDNSVTVEIGPRLCFSTSWCSNAISVANASALDVPLQRIERSIRYRVEVSPSVGKSSDERVSLIVNCLFTNFHDRMTQEVYETPLASFETVSDPQQTFEVDIMGKGISALETANQELGLAFDAQDIKYYYNLFADKIKRNPSSVEIFDIAQSNSEHSRHWFFKGNLYTKGEKLPFRLWDLIKRPYLSNPNNSVLALCDNASAIKGFNVTTLLPQSPSTASPVLESNVSYDLTLTAETHNFPSGVAPFPGAETGTGGRIRDGMAAGKGSLVVASTAAYCVGNLRIPGYTLDWEDESFEYPDNMASPLKILIDASNGASDYGNKFGEPLVQGFTRSFGMRFADGERREWIKPIMFSGGIGQMSHEHLSKCDPTPKMLIVKLGGPAYRIGMGGGAASSMVQGENASALDFNAVQRGDAEMEQRAGRVIRACVEMGSSNPIVSIHDQGAGGSGNVLKEIVYPSGGVIDIRKMVIGDHSMSVLELWGAEYQENFALLLMEKDLNLFKCICERENSPFAVLGEVSGDGRIKVIDSASNAKERCISTPVDLDLNDVLGDMPPKDFHLSPFHPLSSSLTLMNNDLTSHLIKVLRLPSVSSKRFLTNKVDRSVTGLVAQQQCVGPLHTPLSDVAVVAQSHFAVSGTAFSIGEQPIKGLLNPKAMARLSVGESLTNIMWAKVTSLSDIRCSGNWMYAAKLKGEGMAMYEAAEAASDLMVKLGIAIDGGKDSLSMAARVRRCETVMAPGSLVISSYVSCPDITKTVTPDLKAVDESVILFIDISKGKTRLGGSAFYHVNNSIGSECPDLEDVEQLKNTFQAVQSMIDENVILSGHDRSDGGLLVCLLEMAFAGDVGIDINITSSASMLHYFFNEELGVAIQISQNDLTPVFKILDTLNLSYSQVAVVNASKTVTVTFNGSQCLSQSLSSLRNEWEETSFQLEALQSNPDCVAQERMSLQDPTAPTYSLSFTPLPTILKSPESSMKVAVVRQEGSNGDREMISAFHMAGFEAWDVHMSDLLEKRLDLDRFNGVAFVGGFSFADVFGSGRGWAATIKFHEDLLGMFEAFRQRPDTFSLGVCNGCQLLSLLGWVSTPLLQSSGLKLHHNVSGRFESRFSTVRVNKSSSIMLKAMEGSVLGVWVAHGEGRFVLPELTPLSSIPLQYVDDSQKPTQKYPFNPNGSDFASAALVSSDGRHLAMMPHPERVVLKWQWPYTQKCIQDAQVSPWLQMFQSAESWCRSFQ